MNAFKTEYYPWCLKDVEFFFKLVEKLMLNWIAEY